MTPEQLDEIEKLAEAATPGPYQVASIYPAYGVFRVQVDEPSECVAMCAVSMNEDADEPHVDRQEAHARNGTNARAIAALLQHAMPLVKALREAREERDVLQAVLNDWQRFGMDREKERDAALAEVERLRGIVEVNDRRLAAVWDESRAEVERLRDALWLLWEEAQDQSRCHHDHGHRVSKPCRDAVKAALKEEG